MLEYTTEIIVIEEDSEEETTTEEPSTSQKKPFFCKFCSRRFEHHYMLKLHLDVHSDVGSYKCRDCGNTYRDKADLRKHHSAVHVTKEVTEHSFECEVCGKKFASLWHVNNHSLEHQNEKPFKCDHCPVSYKTNSSLKYHLAIKHGVDPYPEGPNKYQFPKIDIPLKCQLCPNTFTSAIQLRVHYAAHNGEKPEKCAVCSKVFRTKHACSVHFLEEHSALVVPEGLFEGEPTETLVTSLSNVENGLYKCSECSKTFGSENATFVHVWEAHTQKQSNRKASNKAFKCDLCPKRYTKSTQLMLHYDSHKDRKKRDESLKCQLCPKIFTTLNDLRVHYGTHDEEELHECTVCSKVFRTEHACSVHFLEEHAPQNVPEEPPREEPTEAGNVVDCETSTETLVTTLSNVENGLYECPECSETFGSQSDTFVHVREAHPPKDSGPKSNSESQNDRKKRDESSFKCQLCPKGFAFLSDLRAHYGTHSVDEFHECSVCSKVFQTELACSAHFAEEHSTQNVPPQKDSAEDKRRLYKCSVCSETFESQNAFFVHFWEEHTKKGSRNGACGKLFKCDLCPKTFPKSTQLMLHYDSHVDRKTRASFKCQICPEGFTTLNRLRVHYATHDEESYHECTVCSRLFLNKQACSAHFLEHHSAPHGPRLPSAKVVSVEKPFKCRLCPETFPLRTLLTLHMACHNKPRANQPKRPYYALLMDAQNGPAPKPFKCDLCPNRYHESTQLMLHYGSHTESPPNHTRTDHDRLEREMTQTKKGRETPFQCHLCPKSFAKTMELRAHYVSHRALAPFKCTACHERFKSQNACSVHYLVAHKELDAYMCNECGEFFLDKTVLMIHRVGAHSLQCKVCRKVFGTRNRLEKHTLKHHMNAESSVGHEDSIKQEITIEEVVVQSESGVETFGGVSVKEEIKPEPEEMEES